MSTNNLGMDTVPSNSLQPSVPINSSLSDIDASLAGTVTREFATDANITLVRAEYLTSVLVLTDSPSTLTTSRDVIFPAHFPGVCVTNSTAQTLVLKKSGQPGVSIPAGATIVIGSGVSDVIQAGISDIDAADVGIADAGAYFTATDVEGALQELGAAVATNSSGGGGGGGGALVHVATATVTGAAATSISFSGLSLAADEQYEIDFVFKNATASGPNIAMYFNGDTTATNYHINALTAGSGTGLNTSYANLSRIAGMNASTMVRGRIELVRDIDGLAIALVRTLRDGVSSSIRAQYWVFGWVTASNVTSIAFTSDVASSLAIDSYVKIFKRVTS